MSGWSDESRSPCAVPSVGAAYDDAMRSPPAVTTRRSAGRNTSIVGALAAALGLALGLSLALALAATTPSVTRAAAHDIDIVDFAFEPAELTVTVGEPVTWTNKGTTTHTVTSDDGELDSGDNAPGAAYGHVFEAPGVYQYHCTIHPEMQGTITVLPAPATPPGGITRDHSPIRHPAPELQPVPDHRAHADTDAGSHGGADARADPRPGSGSGGDGTGLALVAGTLAVAVVVGAIVFLYRRRRAA